MKRRIKIFSSISKLSPITALAAILVMAFAPLAEAQEGAGIFQRSRSKPPTFPQSSQDSNAPSYVPVDDADLGTILLLQENNQYMPFLFSISSGLYYTDNAGLSDIDEVEDGYWWSAAGLSFTPQLVGSLYADVAASYQAVRYESNSILDFDEMEAGAGLIYTLRNLGDISLFARYNYDRLVSPRDYAEVYVQHGLVTGFHVPYTIDPNQFVYLRFRAEFGLDANPSPAGNNDLSAILGYRVTMLDDLTLEPYYRIRYLDFDNGREDLSHQVGLSLLYRLGESWYFGASGYYITNDSNHDHGNFEAGTIGGQLGFQKRFK